MAILMNGQQDFGVNFRCYYVCMKYVSVLTLSAPNLKVSFGTAFTFNISKPFGKQKKNKSKVFVNLWEWATNHRK